MKTIAEMSKIWDISTRQIRYLIKNNKIDGVKLVGKTYFIPDNAKNPEVKVVKEIILDETNLIFVVAKNTETVLFKSIISNMQDDQQNFCVFTNSPIDSENITCFKASALSSMLKKYTPSLILFVECENKNLETGDISTLYINQKFNKKEGVSQIYNYALHCEADFTNHGLSLYFKEGVCYAIYKIILSVLNNNITTPVAYNMLNKLYSPSLKYKLPTIQASYSLLIKRLDEAPRGFNIMNVSGWNDIEYTDSNNEINYYSHIFSAIERGVNIDFVFINTPKALAFMKKSFAIKAIIEHLGDNAKIYMVDRNNISKDLLETLHEGFNVYGTESIYYDDLSDYSLGGISADKADIARYTNCANKLKQKAVVISSKKEWIEKYGI